MSDSKENATAIDDQLQTIIRIAKAIGFNDVADLIARRMMGIADKVIAESGTSLQSDAVPLSVDPRVSYGCWHVKPTLAALAEAERKLAETEGWRKLAYDRFVDSEERVGVLTGKLADAEKRAKDAGEHAYYNKRKREVEYAEREYQVAALTRKLATALESLNLLRRVDRDNICPHTPQHGIGRSDELSCYSLIAEKSLATIDAPAGEEAVSPSDWCLTVTCPSCGARCRRKSGHGFGVPHGGVCAANCRNAPPPEPAKPVIVTQFAMANGQGSEAASNLPASQMTAHNGTVVGAAPPGLTFTAFEARRYVNSRYLPDTEDRVATSLLRYADLLEHGDALKRAAEELLIAYGQSAFADAERLAVGRAPLDHYAEQLRSELARAKENR